MTDEEKIRYAVWLSRVGLLRGGAIRQSCVASSKVTTEVLRRLGFEAYPAVCSVIAMTLPYMKRIEAGLRPETDDVQKWWDEDRSYSVGVAYDPTPNPGAWHAHLGVIAGNWFCDPSADQLARPERGMSIEPIHIDMSGVEGLRVQEFKRGRTQMIVGWRSDDGSEEFATVYSLFPADRTFRNLPDFVHFRERYEDMTKSIVRTIRAMDLEGLAGDTLPPLPEIPNAPDDPNMAMRIRSPEERARTHMTNNQLRGDRLLRR